MKVEQAVINPLEEFQSEMTKLDTLLAEGVLKWDKYSLAVGQAVDKLEEASKIGSISLPSAMRAGSADAASAITKARAERELKNVDPQKRIEAVLLASNTIQSQIAKYSQQTAQALSNRVPVKMP